ncbi:B3 domain-containing protein Os03g0120900 isoform X2 [Sorghum bicolor]|uniref:B3 domain-containing protein Os03g0120900 isoform X2 n=1 Tax=Sorghum bicolor TaxID=4558 RepID=UPI000B426082|nr:B3 domain-containing protein Os03g0120900 isoform X2 [Sorghum bicolor]|eukprot:XP_021311480.1 B3 domain-containing protein Os03g0120900 isoform X2 [Sorghum bicolor]
MEEPRRPRFFKVLVDFARRIEIPQAFLCHFPEGRHRQSGTTMVTSAKVVLMNAQGNSWSVELEEIDGHVFLTTGWPTFVEDNCLGKGEFLIFKYDGRMHFIVSFFGVNAVEKSSSWSGSQATENVEGELACPVIPSRKGGHSGDGLITEKVKDFMHTHSQGTIGFLDSHEVICSKDYLETYWSQSETMEDDKAKAVAEVMRTLRVDKLTVDLFCAILCLHKWKVEAAAEYFNVCRGKPQILEQSLKQKFVLQLDFVKGQLQRFFPQDYDSERIKKNNVERPNLSNQPLQRDLMVAPVKRRLVDEYKPCDLSHRQKRIVKLQGNSLQTQTPRRSPRLAHANNTCNNNKKVWKGRAKVLKTPPEATNQVKDRAHESCSLHEKLDNALKAVHEEATGSLSQDIRILDSPRCEVGLSKEHEHDQGDTGKMLDQVNDGENCKEHLGRDAMGNSESFMSTYCVESLPNSSRLTASSRINELSFTWKPSQHVSPLDKVLLGIQRDNFVNTIAHIQKIIRDDPSDVLSADVIEATVRIEIIKWDLCLQDKDAHKIVNAMLEYAKKVKGRQNFNTEMRKEEFSAKLQDLLKWQLKELELTYTSLESDYKKATTDASIFFSTFEEHKKKLNAIKDGIKGVQQACMIKDDEMQKLAHQVAEHETAYQKSIMEKVRVKMALKSHEQTIGYVKEHLASTESGSIDVGALVKIEMDNMSKEIDVSKGNLLNINFKKE